MDRKIEKKSWSSKQIGILIGALAIVLLLLYGYVLRPAGSSVEVNADRITVSQVQLGDFNEFITINASVIPLRSIFLDAVEGGRVERVMAEGGEFVEAGDTLVILSNNNLQLDVMNRETHILEQMNTMRNTRLALQQQRLHLRNELLTHETELEQRRRDFNRDSTLFQRELISSHDFDESRLQYRKVLERRNLFAEQLALDSAATQSELEFIGVSLQNMQRNLAMVSGILDHLVVKAPISGQLTALDAEIGETKTSGQRLGQIDVVDGYKVRAEIDEIYIARVLPGQEASFDFAGNTYKLSISRIYPQVIDGRFLVDLDFIDNQPETLRRGQSLRVRLSFGAEQQALLLPRGGFYQHTAGNWVYVLNSDGNRAVRRDIRIGRQNSQFYVIEEGLTSGERVITSSYADFGNAERLSISGNVPK